MMMMMNVMHVVVMVIVMHVRYVMMMMHHSILKDLHSCSIR